MKHALITGASSGIGLALACRLAAQGWQLSIIARDQARLDAAQARISAGENSGVRTYSVDVCDAARLSEAVSAAVQAFGPLGLVVSSAGVVVPDHFEALPAEAFRFTMEVNYFGTVNLVRAALPLLAQNAQIVLISSAAGLIGLYGYTAYAPSKFAVRGFAEALRSELAPRGIAVSVVYPPDTQTPQLEEEMRVRPEETSAIAAGASIHSADSVADAIMAGIRKRRFLITPGWEITLLARLHSLIGPLLNRFSFDPAVARVKARRARKS